MPYRTRTYIAADWTNDYDAVERLHKWNDSEYWSLSFSDAHDLKQAYVGEKTAQLTAGGCRYCDRYSGYWHTCSSGYTVDHRSYIEYECEKAIEADIKIVVLYKSASVNKNLCPTCIRNYGVHIPMYRWDYGDLNWNYTVIKNAIQ